MCVRVRGEWRRVVLVDAPDFSLEFDFCFSEENWYAFGDDRCFEPDLGEFLRPQAGEVVVLQEP